LVFSYPVKKTEQKKTGLKKGKGFQSSSDKKKKNKGGKKKRGKKLTKRDADHAQGFCETKRKKNQASKGVGGFFLGFGRGGKTKGNHGHHELGTMGGWNQLTATRTGKKKKNHTWGYGQTHVQWGGGRKGGKSLPFRGRPKVREGSGIPWQHNGPWNKTTKGKGVSRQETKPLRVIHLEQKLKIRGRKGEPPTSRTCFQNNRHHGAGKEMKKSKKTKT